MAGTAKRKGKGAKAPRGTESSKGPGLDWSPSQGPVRVDLDGAYYEFIGLGDQRLRDRVPREELGEVAAGIRRGEGAEWAPVRLLDFSSVGFGIHLPSRSPVAFGGPDVRPMHDGDEVEVRLAIGNLRPFTAWCGVRHVSPWQGGWRLGLRRLDLAFPGPGTEERRATGRLSLSPALALRARFRHPFLFDRWCEALLTDLNRDLGLAFSSEDPTALLFEGMRLELHLDLAGTGGRTLVGRVAWVQAAGSHRVKAGLAAVDMPFELHDALCAALLRTGYWTPSALRTAGLQGGRVKGQLRYATVKTLEDYAEVLQLRREAGSLLGNLPAETRPERLSTPLDGRSRILVARHNGKAAGTVTFAFPPSEDTVLDSQRGFPGLRYPVYLPPKTNMIEAYGLCIDPNYAGTDLLVGLFEHGLKHFLLSDRHWILAATTEELWPLYRRIGFVRLKASFRRPLADAREHHLVIAHRSAFLFGFGMGLLAWNSVSADLVRHLLDRGLLTPPGWVRAVIRAKLWFRPVARFLTDARARRAFRKHLLALRRPPGLRPEEAAPAPGSLYAGLELDAPAPDQKKTGA